MLKKWSNLIINIILKKLLFPVSALICLAVIITLPIKISPYLKYSIIAIFIIFTAFWTFENVPFDMHRFALSYYLCGLAVISRCIFFMIPFAKPFLAIIILSSAALGPLYGFTIGSISCLVSNIFLGQGPWTIWQAFASGVCGLLSGIVFYSLKVKPSALNLCIFSFISVAFIYSPIIDFSSFLLFSPDIRLLPLAVFFMTSIPANIIHIVSTLLFVAILSKLYRQTLSIYLTYFPR